jgi:poly(A) polymerase
MMRPFSLAPLPASAFLDLPGLPPSLPSLLAAAAAADRLALVGGAVRDLLLHRVHNDPWQGVPDLDLVVEPAPIEAGDPSVAPAHRLARRLVQRLGPAGVISYREHTAYGTAELELNLEEGPLLLDLASARHEIYAAPGENPKVAFGSLADDLARRDFSINAMALMVGDGSVTLLDPHGGQADLGCRQLRLLHGSSLQDDPTRIVRGARYAARLGFALAPDSLEQWATTLARWPWAWRPGDHPGLAPPALATRLRMELDLLLEREPWRAGLEALQSWRALELLDPDLQRDRRWPWRLRHAERMGLPLLPALLLAAGDPLAVAERLQLPHRHQQLLAQARFLGQRLAVLDPGQAPALWAPSRWCDLLESSGVTAEAVALVVAAGGPWRRPLLRWWLRWRHLRSPRTAAALIEAGMTPGPQLGQRLRQLRAERLDAERR